MAPLISNIGCDCQRNCRAFELDAGRTVDLIDQGVKEQGVRSKCI